MSRYAGIPCPMCGQPFTEKDDIVVCPVCGTPHHRACYHDLGHCVNEARHDEGFVWQAPKGDMDENKGERHFAEQEHGKTHDDPYFLICPRCKTINPPHGIFCQMCGAPLKSQVDPSGNLKNPAQQGGGYPPFSPAQMAYSPYGGLDPDDVIDGITVREIAAYIGPNSQYYLPRFKLLSAHRSVLSWNWSAVIGNFVFFLYRKLYLIGILALVVFLACQIPSVLLTARLIEMAPDLQSSMSLLEEMPDSLAFLYRLQQICSYAFFLFSLAFGLFANGIYLKHVLASIRRIKDNHPEISEYERLSFLTRHGGINRKIIIALLLVVLFLNVIMLYGSLSLMYY